MDTRKNVSAGLLLFRQRDGRLELFLAHPGGPYWAGRDEGAWTIPKGLVEASEDMLACACREFREETGLEPQGPFIPLGSVRQKAGKTVQAWAWEGDANPAAVVSNTMRMQYPPGSGRWITVPEVDRCAWFTADEAKRRINPAQAELIERLQSVLAG